MKSIMAEAAVGQISSSNPTLLPPAVRPTPSAAETNNWRSGQAGASSSAQQSSRGPPGSPWKTPPPSTNVARLAPIPSPARTPPATPLLRSVRPKDEKVNSQSPQIAGPSRPGLGPVISPHRQGSWKSTNVPAVRRISCVVCSISCNNMISFAVCCCFSGGQPAWTLPPVQPVVQSSSSTSGMSFVAIQQLQLEQDTTPKIDKRSLKQIQEEEAARQVEEDFMKWWAAEEERLRIEHEASTPSKAQKRPKPRKQGAPGKDKPHLLQQGAQNTQNKDMNDSNTQDNDKNKSKGRADRKDGQGTSRAKRKPAVAAQPQTPRGPAT